MNSINAQSEIKKTRRLSFLHKNLYNLISKHNVLFHRK